MSFAHLRPSSGSRNITDNTRPEKVQAIRSRRGHHAAVRVVCEMCEPRMLLAATLRGKIPTSIAANSATQTLLAPGTNSFSLTSNSTTTAANSSFRFSVNNAVNGQLATFTTAGATTTDAAIAIYDASGNRIALQDTDTGSTSTETYSAALTSGTLYTVGFYGLQNVAGSANLALTINPGAQKLGSTLSLDPATHSGTLSTAAAPDAFTSSSDVRYIPLKLFDAGNEADVSVSPLGPDVAVKYDLFLHNGGDSWTHTNQGSLASGVGLSNFIIPSPGTTNITDGEYVLAIAPLNFTAAPQPVSIAASTPNPLAPATTSPTGAFGGLTETLTAPGTLSGTVQAFLGGGSTAFTTFTAPISGEVTLSNPAGYPQYLAVYSPGGTQLIAISSTTISSVGVQTKFTAVAGSTYVIALANKGTSLSTYTLSATQSPAPTEIAVGPTVGQQANQQIDPNSGSKLFRLTTSASSKFLALQLAPDSGSTLTATITLIGSDGVVHTMAGGSAGAPATLVLDQSNNAGPYDVLISSPSGTGTASFKYTALALPDAPAINQYPTSLYNLATGGISSPSIPVSTGVPVGLQYFQPANASGAPNTLFTSTALNTNTTSILLHYVSDGTTFRLQESASPAGTSTSPNLFVPVRGQVLHAIVALPISFGSGSAVQLTVGGPKPTGVPLATVPNALPGQGIPPGGFLSIASLQNGKITSVLQRDLYSVQVPFNASSTSSTLVYTPNQSNGPLSVVVNILNASNNVIATATSTAGGSLSIPVTGLVAGQPIRFEIKTVAGTNIGDGAYKLTISFATTNPLPYLVTQQFFYPPAVTQTSGLSYLPIGYTDASFPTIPVNGSVQGNFTTSSAYDNSGSGSIKVFKITGWTLNAPFTVSTTDVDAGVNTNFALFTLGTDDQGRTAYRRLAGSAPSFDYLPGDRTSVDSKIVVNNTDLDGVYGGGEISSAVTVYAILMNEQGTQGRFNIAVSQPNPLVIAGPGNSTPQNIIIAAPRAGGTFVSGRQTLQTANATTFTVRTPSDMTSGGTAQLTVATVNHSVGQTVTVSVGNGIFSLGSASGVVGAGGTVTIALQTTTAGGGPVSPILGPGGTYSVTITASSFPAGGLALNLTVPYATVTGTVPASTLTSGIPLDAGYNSAISRIRPAPSGVISETPTVSGGVFGTLFSMAKAGTVSFTINSASTGAPAVGLYQQGKTGGPPYNDVSVLVDFDNTRNASNNFTIGAVLPAGTYWLRGQGFDSSAITITGTSPAAPTKVLEVEPSTGLTQQSEQTIINQGSLGNTSGTSTNGVITSRSASNFFKFVVPANASGAPVSFSLDDGNQFGYTSPVAPVGTATLSIYKLVGSVYTRIGSTINAVGPGVHHGTVTANEPAVPGTEYFVGVDFNGFQYAAYVGFNCPIFTSGVGDYSVQPVTLAPNAGSTLVQSSIFNGSFSPSAAGQYTFQLGNQTVTRSIPSLAPFGSLTITQTWQPTATTDQVVITANPTHSIPELSTTNNTASVALANYDTSTPTAQISLADAAMTAEGTAGYTTGGGTWGRYIAGVSGQTSNVLVKGHDSDGDLYQLIAYIARPDGTHALDSFKVFYSGSNTDFTSSIPFDFGTLQGTTLSNLNQLKFYAVDSFGLKTPTFIQLVDVATPPSFLVGGIPGANVQGAGGTITFSKTTHQFTYNFTDAIINLNNTLSDLLNFDVPVVGDKKNEFLVSITGTGTGGLNPNVDVPLSLSGHAKLTALDQSLFQKDVNGTQTSGSITFRTQMTLAGRSLVPSSTSVSLQVANLQLVDYKSPLIPIVSIGLPGVAEVKAGIKFGLNASLNAGAKIGFDPLAGGVGGYLGSLGVMSPTFVQPTITGTATVAGDVSVLGFDIAELSGSVSLTLTVTLGLDNNVPGAIIGFANAATDLALRVDATVKIHVAAHIAILGDVYTYDPDPITGTLVNTIHQGIFTTDPPTTAHMLGPNAAKRGISSALGDPIIKNGASLVGPYTIDPTPQIVINNAAVNGMGLSMQLVNAGTASAPLANLAFTNRVNGTWSPLTTLAGTNDVANPVLALSHDGSGTPGVVVYDADKIAGSPATQTLNQRLTSQDIRYRYFDGTNWGAEQSLTNDSLYDSQQSVAFNANGEGVLAYVHNTNATPMSSTGQLDSASNDISASVWNPFTHSWGTPLVVTSTAGSDTSPSTFIDATGKRYVVWVHNEGGASTLMYSTNTGSGWSPQAVLSTSGLAAGGTFTNVALGSDGANRIDTVFSYVAANADGTLSTTLYHRPATVAGFANTLPAVQIAANSTFSGLKTTSAPSGALVAYWQQSDGESNQIVETTITNGIATTPVQISDSPNLAKQPSAAVDGDGKVQLLYGNSTMYGGVSQGAATDPTVGAPVTAAVGTSSISSLPQLTFTKGLAFPVESQASAPIGSTITGTATIANRGLATANVTVTAYRGIPGSGGVVVGTPFSITLAPGATYNISQAFTVVAGDQTYSIQVTTPGQNQAFNSTTENISSAKLKGLGDLTTTLINDVGSPSPGSTQSLQAFVTNNSNVASGSFVVTLYQGDPLSPQSPLTPIASQTVSSLGANATTLLSFPVTLPGVAGDFIYTARVDSTDQINESNENNNIGRYEVHFRADPAIVFASDGTAPVTATLLNSGTSNNVQVTVNVANSGATNMTNVPVNLRVSRNGGGFINLGQQVIPSLPSGGTAVVTFTVTSLGGDNQYVASFDDSIDAQDVNLANNFGTASLIVPGIATLTSSATLSAASSLAGSPLSLIATVTNSGLADATGVPLVVLAQLASGGPTFTVGSGTINLGGVSSGSTSITLDTSMLGRGVYNFTLQVDPQETLLKSAATPDFTLSAIITTPLVLSAASEYLKLDADGQRLDVWNNATGTGTPDQQIQITTISSIVGTPITGSQKVSIDFSAGIPLPSGGFAFSSPAGGANALNIIGSAGVDTFNLNGGALMTFSNATTAAVTINRANASSVTFTGGGGSDVINLAPGNSLPSTLHLDGTFAMNEFSSFAGTTLDLGKSTLFINYTAGNSPAATIRQYLQRGYNVGGWNGTATATLGAINSAFANSNPLTGIGYADFGDGSGINTTPNSVELKYTLRADATLNGTVNFDDLVALAQSYNKTGRVFSQADLNYDGVVNFDDLVILAQEYNKSLAALVIAPAGKIGPVVRLPTIDNALAALPPLAQLPRRSPTTLLPVTAPVKVPAKGPATKSAPVFAG